MDYLINFAISFSGYLAGFVLFFLILPFALQRLIGPAADAASEPSKASRQLALACRISRGLGLVVLVFGLFMSLSEPSNTYKNRSHDNARLNQQIEQQILSRQQAAPIQDRSRQPDLTREERAERFDEMVDYRKEGEAP